MNQHPYESLQHPLLMKAAFLLLLQSLALSEQSSTYGDRYKVLYPKVSFSNAKKLCQSEGHELATFHTGMLHQASGAIKLAGAKSAWLRLDDPDIIAVLLQDEHYLQVQFYKNPSDTKSHHPVLCKILEDSTSTGPSLPYLSTTSIDKGVKEVKKVKRVKRIKKNAKSKEVKKIGNPVYRPARTIVAVRVNGVSKDPDSSCIQNLMRDIDNIHLTQSQGSSNMMEAKPTRGCGCVCGCRLIHRCSVN